jgi:hypothetical protein
VTFSESREDGRYRRLPKIDQSQLQFLWHSDFWDGPKNGLLVLDGRKYWFQVFEESADPDLRDFYRRFLIVELTPVQLAEEEEWHMLFQEKVGRYSDYGSNAREELAKVRPRHVQEEFYRRYRGRIPLDIGGNRAVGWFES